MDHSLTPDVAGWVHAVCRAPSAEPADMAGELGIDLTSARRVGSQLVCTPPAGADHFELALDPATRIVSFAEARLAPHAPLERFTALLGTAREAPPGPHDTSPTMVFDPFRPTGASRSCAVLARLAPLGDGPKNLVMSVILYLHHP
jgi:hypothetical protein